MIPYKNKRRLLSALILLAMALCLTAGCGTTDSGDITSIEQLNEPGRKIGMSNDTNDDKLVAERLPQAGVEYYQDAMAGYLSVSQGKLDAFVYGKLAMDTAIRNGMQGVRLLDETLGESYTMAVAIAPNTKIPDLEDKINAFLEEVKQDGTLDDMIDRWLVRKDETMPEIAVPESSDLHLVVGTSGVYEPFTYYVGTELRGYDIELAYRFAAWLGASLEFKVYDYGGIIAAAQGGDVDCLFAAIFITPERQEALRFSQPTYVEEIAVMVRDTGSVPEASGNEVHWQDYNGKRLGVLVGPLMEDAAAEFFPDSEYLLFDTYPDCIAALLTGKIDGYLVDEPGVKSTHAENPEIDYIHERLTENNYSFAFRKDDPESAALCGELNEFLARCWADGTMQELDDIWLGVDEARKVVDMSDLTGENGTIRVVTTSTDMPWSYIKDGKNVGYDIDLVVRFCRDRGYALELGDVDFAGRIPAIQSGKYDFTTDMNVTPEREEQVLFSNPTSQGGIVLAVRASDLAMSASQGGNRGNTGADDPQGETSACTPGSVTAPEYREYADLSGKRVSMLTGAPFEELVRSKAPDVGEFSFFNNTPDMILALKSGKTDAFLTNNAVAALAVNRNPELALFPQELETGVFGIAFAKDDPQRDVWQAAYDSIPEETKQALWEKWTGSDASAKTLPEQDWSGTNGTVQAAVCDTLEPMSYIGDGGQIIGFDIEMILLMAKELDVHVEFTGMEFSAVMSSVQAGKALLGAGSIIATDERKQSVDFVEYYPAAFVLVVRTVQAEAGGEAFSSLDELAGKHIGVVTGTIHDKLVEQRLPTAQIVYYNAISDMLDALKAGKIDALVRPLSGAVFIRYEDQRITWLDEHLTDADVSFAFPKTEEGRALNERFSAFIRALRASGELDALREKWFSEDESLKTMIDYAALPAANGTLRMATAGTQVPFNYVRDGTVVGFEIELAARFCEENGYALNVEPMNFDGVLASVQSGKCDFAGSCLAVTEERMESVDFSEPHFAESVVFVVLDSTAGDQGSFLRSVAESFEKTFLRENRWQLFLSGIGTTLLITVLSILFGTALGFGVFMLCRNGNPVANAVTRFCVWLVQGMPVVVLLMILYYIIFGKVAISGAAVSVVGFTLVFGAAVYAMLRSGVGAIDRGQTEAAYALGYTDRKAFFRVVLPQALPHFMPAYKGEITALIKATAVVGYVAVQDLTKMGDIVRSRTYEAFFPLIAVAVIYFILAAILTFIVNKIEIRIDPRRRSRDSILKGVDVQ